MNRLPFHHPAPRRDCDCNPSVTFAATAAAYVLNDMRAAGQHEQADRIEADLAEAVRIILRASGPRLRGTIRRDVLHGGPA